MSAMTTPQIQLQTLFSPHKDEIMHRVREQGNYWAVNVTELPIPLVQKLIGLNYKIIDMVVHDTGRSGKYCELHIDFNDKLIVKLHQLYDDVEYLAGVYRIVCETVSVWDCRELGKLNCTIINIVEGNTVTGHQGKVVLTVREGDGDD